MDPAAVKITSALFWKATALFAAIDLVLVGLLVRRVKAERFRQLKWFVVVVAFLFWGTIWTFAMWGSWWKLAYCHLFPEWARYLVPPLYATMFAAAGLLIWWLAIRLPGQAALNFCLLGGLLSLPGHLWGIYGRGMFAKVPLLQAAKPVPALVFGIFEFILYWILILSLALLACRRGGSDSQI